MTEEQVVVDRGESWRSVLGQRCGWRGCRQTFTGEVPDDWTNLMVTTGSHKAAFTATGDLKILSPAMKWRHDKCLCPEHTQALDFLLEGGEPQ